MVVAEVVALPGSAFPGFAPIRFLVASALSVSHHVLLDMFPIGFVERPLL
jgi:hypothetical protein